jgi:hypothetical protein
MAQEAGRSLTLVEQQNFEDNDRELYLNTVTRPSAGQMTGNMAKGLQCSIKKVVESRMGIHQKYRYGSMSDRYPVCKDHGK